VKQEEYSDLTGNPCMLDVVCTSIEAVRKYIDFVSETTEAPFLLDAYSKVRVEALKYVAEIGIIDRVIYNSIYNPSETEIDAIRNSKVEAAILLAYNAKNRTTEGVISLLKGTDDKPGLLEVSKSTGITKPLVDTTVFTYIPSVGIGAKSCLRVKKELGLPAGGAPGNAASLWKHPKEWVYGVIEAAPLIFPICSVVDSMIASTAQVEYGLNTITEEHPLYKLFPEFAKKIQNSK
jgi:tetrahydromethanopterin S-methyltransferase subunit H